MLSKQQQNTKQEREKFVKNITDLHKKLRNKGVRGFQDDGTKFLGKRDETNEEILMQIYQDHFQTEAEGKPDADQLMQINKQLTYMLNFMYEQGFNRQVDNKRRNSKALGSGRSSQLAAAGGRSNMTRESREGKASEYLPTPDIAQTEEQEPEEVVDEEEELKNKMSRFDGENCYSREEAAMKAFAYELEKLEMTPESFFRLADEDNTGFLTPGEFKNVLKKLKINLERSQIKRILMICDEDLSGEISHKEFLDALEAYDVAQENHLKDFDESQLTVQRQVLFRLLVELENKQISHYEMFNSCDESGDGNVDLKELENFLEGLGLDFKKKEVHSLLQFLDVDKSHTIQREEFLRQMKRAQNLLENKAREADMMEFSQALQTQNFYTSQGSTLNKRTTNVFSRPPTGGYGKVKDFNERDDGEDLFQQEDEVHGDQALAPEDYEEPNHPKVETDEDLKRGRIIHRMEKEGLNFELFFKHIKTLRKKGNEIQLGAMLKALETNYPTISSAERAFVIQVFVGGKKKVDYIKLEELFTSYSENLRPSPEQTLSIICNNLCKRIGKEPEHALKEFFLTQDLTQASFLDEEKFLLIFSQRFGALKDQDLRVLFQSFNLDSRKRLKVRVLQQALLKYAEQSSEQHDKISLAQIEVTIPGFTQLSPRTRSQEVITYLVQELKNKNLRPLNVFRMAEKKENDTALKKDIIAAFQKLLPHVTQELLEQPFKAFKQSDQRLNEVNLNTFLSVFEHSLKTEKEKSKLEGTQEITQVDEETWTNIRLLDDKMLEFGLSPLLVFKNADINRNGQVSLDELEKSIKKLLPDQSLDQEDIIKIMKALDKNGNGELEEKEFIQSIGEARNHNVTIIKREMNQPRLKGKKNQTYVDSTKEAIDDQGLPLVNRDLKAIVQKIKEKFPDVKERLTEKLAIQPSGLVDEAIVKRVFIELEDDKEKPVILMPEYAVIRQQLDPQETGWINASDLIQFCQKYLQQEESTFILELKYLANFIEFKHKERNTAQFFRKHTQLKSDQRLLQVEILSTLRQFGINSQTSLKIITHLQNNKADKKSNDIFLSDLAQLIDEYRATSTDEEIPEEDLHKTEEERIMESYDKSLLKITLWIEYLGKEGQERLLKMYPEGMSYEAFIQNLVENYQALEQKDARVFYQRFERTYLGFKLQKLIEITKDFKKSNLLKDMKVALGKQLQKNKGFKNGLEEQIAPLKAGTSSTLSLTKVVQRHLNKSKYQEELKMKWKLPQSFGIGFPEDAMGMKALLLDYCAAKEGGFYDALKLIYIVLECTIDAAVARRQLKNVEQLSENVYDEFLFLDILFAKYLASLIDQPQVSTVEYYIKKKQFKAVIENQKDLGLFLNTIVPEKDRQADTMKIGSLIYRFAFMQKKIHLRVPDSPFILAIDKWRSQGEGKNEEQNQKFQVNVLKLERTTTGVRIEQIFEEINVLKYHGSIDAEDFVKLLLGPSLFPDAKPELAEDLRECLETGSNQRIQWNSLAELLSKMKGRFRHESVLEHIADQIGEPLRKKMEQAGLDKNKTVEVQGFRSVILRLGVAVSPFHIFALFRYLIKTQQKAQDETEEPKMRVGAFMNAVCSVYNAEDVDDFEDSKPISRDPMNDSNVSGQKKVTFLANLQQKLEQGVQNLVQEKNNENLAAKYLGLYQELIHEQFIKQICDKMKNLILSKNFQEVVHAFPFQENKQNPSQRPKYTGFDLIEGFQNLGIKVEKELFLLTFLALPNQHIKKMMTADLDIFLKAMTQFSPYEVQSYKKILERNYWSLKEMQESKKRDPIQQIKPFIDIMKRILSSKSSGQENQEDLLDLFIENEKKLPYKDLYHFFTTIVPGEKDTIASIHREIVQVLDKDKKGHFALANFDAFCTQNEIPFSVKAKKKKNTVITKSSGQDKFVIGQEDKDKGELYKVENLEYRIQSERDYYRGIPTILNSEAAALVIAEHLYNKVAENDYFVDPDFGPKNDDDFEGNSNSLYFEARPPAKGYTPIQEITWRHAQEIHSSSQFIDDGVSAGDVKQGNIGNCWFMGALSVLATKDELLRGGSKNTKTTEFRKNEIDAEMAWKLSQGVYPPIFHMYRAKGLYVFRFFKNYKWRYVIVDSRVPLQQGVQYVFGHCKNQKELWVPLIEKAYAKLHGCYETLISGFLDDGISDLTGMPCEKVKLQDKTGNFNTEDFGSPDQLWNFLLQRRDENCMIGCSITGDTEGELRFEGEMTGLIKGHAYGLLDVFQLENKDLEKKKGRKFHRLLRLRNPWGKTEWKGKWSDFSIQVKENKELLQEYINKLDPDERFILGDDDGTFLMCFSDWRMLFNNINVALDFPQIWTGIRFEASWDAYSSGGTPIQGKEPFLTEWARNPQFAIEVQGVPEAELFISLAQPDGRVRASDGSFHKYPFIETIHPICMSLMRPEPSQKFYRKFDSNQILKLSPMKIAREVSFRVKLKKGRYILVPSTRESGKIGKFFLSIYFDCKPGKIKVHRLDKPEHSYSYIAEESEDHQVSEWKIELLNKRKQFIVMDEDSMNLSMSQTQ